MAGTKWTLPRKRCDVTPTQAPGAGGVLADHLTTPSSSVCACSRWRGGRGKGGEGGDRWSGRMGGLVGEGGAAGRGGRYTMGDWAVLGCEYPARSIMSWQLCPGSLHALPHATAPHTPMAPPTRLLLLVSASPLCLLTQSHFSQPIPSLPTCAGL